MPLPRYAPLFVAALICFSASLRLQATEPESLWLGDEDRLLVLSPHPDDETLAAGGLIQEALDLDLPVRVCFFTMGDNHEIASLFTRRPPRPLRPLGTLRQNEAVAAGSQLGLTTNQLLFLGYPDSGTLDIWHYHWRDAPPLQSMLTQATAVPFESALSTGAPYSGESIVDDLTKVIRDFQPTYIVVSHTADHNVDHRALALFTRIALWNLAADGFAPEVLAAPVHFTQWPQPRQMNPTQEAHAPYFLDAATEWIQYGLAPYQVSNKIAALRRYHSQMTSTPAYLEPFIRKTELFGLLRELTFPGGVGIAEFAEEDTSQFRPDSKGFLSLNEATPIQQSLRDQQAAESRALRKSDNDFLMQYLNGDGVDLTLGLQFLSPISSRATLTVFLFPYQSDRPFGMLPKLVLEIRNGTLISVTDLDEPLPRDAVSILPSEPDTVTIRIPYSLLGQPEKLLLGAQLSQGALPIDWTPWRVLDFAGLPFGLPVPEDLAPERKPEESTEPASLPPPREEAVEAPAPPVRPVTRRNRLIPRVRLPEAPLPAQTEADEPVLW